MDKIWNPHAWPKPLYQNLPLTKYIKQTNYIITQYCFPSKFIDYILSVCNERQIPVEIFQLTLSISSRYMIKNSRYSQPLQLVLLSSLFIAGKVIGNTNQIEGGGFTINQLHKYSNHCFTNKDFYRIERKILQQLRYSVLSQGIADKQIKIILLMLRQIMNDQYFQLLCKVCEDVQTVIWNYLFTKSDKQKLLKKNQGERDNKYERLLSAAIVQASLILSTHCVGRFPATVWMIHVLELKQDQLSLCVQDVLKIVLGKEKFQQLKL